MSDIERDVVGLANGHIAELRRRIALAARALCLGDPAEAYHQLYFVDGGTSRGEILDDMNGGTSKWSAVS